MKNEATFSGIFRELISLVGDARRNLAIYTLVLGGLAVIGVTLGLAEPASSAFSGESMARARGNGLSGKFQIFTTVVSVVASYMLIKRHLALRGRLQSAGNRFWPYFGMMIVSGLAVLIGLILLVVPGVILLVRWSAASGFLIGGNRRVFESLAESWHATKGSSGAIFLAGFALTFGLTATVLIFSLALDAINPLLGGIVSSFAQAASGAVYVSFGVAVYCLLQGDTREFEEVFA